MVAKVIINLEAIRNAREKKGLSLSDVSSALGFKTPTGYWLIEQGQRKVSIDSLYRLAELYGTGMEDLVCPNPKYFEQ